MSASGGLAILAVDDEPRALADIKHLLETSASVDRVATATSAKEALVYLSGGRYDALFLDVHMPEIEGMALARLLRRFADPPAVVFVTGHPDAAVEAFEIQALDFLVKPVSRERLESALGRVEAQSRPAAPAAAAQGDGAASPAGATGGGPDVVAVDNPKGGGKRLVRLETISIAQANGDYARIVCDDGRFLLRTPLSQLEKEWSPSGFARVHRAYLVNLTHAVELRAQLNGTAVLIMRDGTEVPVARRNVAALRRRLHA
jgi:DNA-binding LytR/AlgR family response regulator